MGHRVSGRRQAESFRGMIAAVTGVSVSAAESLESRAREHPVLTEVRDCVRYIVELMVRHEWERGDTRELAAAWSKPISTVENYSAEAARHLEYLDEREYWMRRIQHEADKRLGSAEDSHFPAIARIAADTVGGFTQKQEVTVAVQQNPAEIAHSVVEWLKEHAPEKIREAYLELERGASACSCGVMAVLTEQGCKRCGKATALLTDGANSDD